jgi:hypothetical protein
LKGVAMRWPAETGYVPTDDEQFAARRKLVLSWAKHKQRIDLPWAKEKSAKSESWKCSDINTEWEENYGDDKTHRAQDGTHCPQDWT